MERHRIDPREHEALSAIKRPPPELKLPDPGITRGPFKVFQRTDLKWIVYDERLPMGKRTVGEPHKDAEAATTAATALQLAEASMGE